MSAPRRGALIGFGFIAEKGHWPTYAENGAGCELVAIADPCQERRELARALVPQARVYESHETLLAMEHMGLDFVDIATPPYAHAQIAHAAFDRGLHVLCEKPLATDPRAAAALLARARATSRVLFPVHNYKHAPVVRAVAQALAEGAIGEVHAATLQTFRPTHARGVAEWRPDWRRERAFSGGGIGMDHGSHTFYLAFDWLQAYPEAVSATAHTRAGDDTEETLSCTVRFPEQRLVTATLTWTAGMRRVIYTLHGTRGAIRVEDDDVEVVHMRGTPPDASFQGERALVQSRWADASHKEWFRPVLEAFVRAIDRRDFTGTEAEDAFRCVALIDAAYRSAALGSREVPITLGHGAFEVEKTRVGMDAKEAS